MIVAELCRLSNDKCNAFFLFHLYFAETTSLKKSSLTQVSDSMTDIYVKPEIYQNDSFVNVSLHNQTLHDDSLFASSHDPVCECELPQWDIKPELNLKSDETAATADVTVGSQHLDQQDDVSVVSSDKYSYGL